ncbi:MAG: hypothetical protein MUC49_15470 [Raineya sp.]|jgi:hypothetical protein|nr:hypothetical protein [Raineya sp.]
MLHIHRTTENKTQQEQTNFYAQSREKHVFSLVVLSISMKIALCVILLFPFLVLGQVKNKTKTQTRPKEPPHEELRSALYDGRYKDALKYISQGADIRKTDTLETLRVSREKQGTLDYPETSSPRAGAFIGIILPFVAAAEGLAQKSSSSSSFSVTCKIVDIALNDALEDTIKSPERLKIIEYCLQKGADPDGAYKYIPLYLSITQRDIEITKLLLQYKAKPDVSALWTYILRGCPCVDTSANSQDTKKVESFKNVVGLLLEKKPKLEMSTLGKFYKKPEWTKWLLKYYTLEELNKMNNPIYTACYYADLKLFKEYETMGFGKSDIYKNDKLYDTIALYNAKFYEYIYPKGFDVNYEHKFGDKLTFFCRVIEYSTDVDFIRILLTMKPDFCVPCNPLGLLQEKIIRYKNNLEKSKDDKDYNKYLTRYNKLLTIEPLLEDYYKTLPKEQKKIILESLKKYKTYRYELSVFLKKTYIKKLKKL